MGHLDIRHKETIRLYPKEFFELFLPDVASQFRFESARYMDKELSDFFGEIDREGRVDALFGIKRKNAGRWTDSIIHWEQQGTKRKNSGERMFHYSSGLYFRYRKPIFPVIMFTDPAVWRIRVPDEFRMGPGEAPVNVFRFRLLKLKDYLAEEFVKRAPDNPLTWAYLPFTRYNRIQMFHILIQALQGVLRTERRAMHRATLVSLIEHSVPLSESERREFRTILARELKHSEVNMLQSIKEVGIEIGIAKGIEKGLEQGHEKGERRTTLRYIKAMLAKDLSWEFITDVTGVTAKKFQKLQAEEVSG